MEKKIGGKVGIWLRDFLMGRTQRVIANGEASQISKMISGVPQGTVLGPVLFLLIIDSLGDLKLNATIMSFADDSKITMPIHNIEDALTLQECLEKLDKWQTDNNMCFNVSKFNVLQMGKSQDLKEDYNYITPGNSDVILPCEVVRDLGVLINSKGTYTDHIAKISKKAAQKIGMILRTFSNRTPNFLKFIWKTYLQPVLDYASQLYAPVKGGLLMKLEHILESFTAKIEGYDNISYWERLKLLKMYSISRRNERYRMIYCQKIILGQTQNCGTEYSYTPEYGYQFEIPKFKDFSKGLREQSFGYMGPKLYNSLPLYLRITKDISIETWKEKLDEFLENIPDNPITLRCTSGLCDVYTTKPTNSLIYWIPFLHLSGRRENEKKDKLRPV